MSQAWMDVGDVFQEMEATIMLKNVLLGSFNEL